MTAGVHADEPVGSRHQRVGDVQALPFGCLAQRSVSAGENRCAHEERRREMDCVVAPQRLGLRELRCALDQLIGHLDKIKIVDERGQLCLGDVELVR